jgi:uncharacterized protein
MRIFDPHIHMTSRTTDDYERMHAAGVRAVVEPSFWLGQPRTSVDTFCDYFDALLGWEPFRAEQFGVQHFATIGLNPKEANDERCRAVLGELPRYLDKDRVVAVGELGYDSMTPEEDEVFAHQLGLAREHGLPALVHTPHRDKLAGTRRTLDVVRESGLPAGLVLVDHLNEVTVGVVAESGCWMGFSIYPDTKMDPQRMVAILQEYGTERMVVNSAADWGRSDPLLTVRTAEAMVANGFSEDDIDRVLWRNPVEFYGQSGRLELDEVARDAVTAPAPTGSPAVAAVPVGAAAGATFRGNSVVRGSRDG